MHIISSENNYLQVYLAPSLQLYSIYLLFKCTAATKPNKI